jgi:hypothetical protein
MSDVGGEEGSGSVLVSAAGLRMTRFLALTDVRSALHRDMAIESLSCLILRDPTVQALNVFERHLVTKPDPAHIRSKQTRTPERNPIVGAAHDDTPKSLKSVSENWIDQRYLTVACPRASQDLRSMHPTR